VRSSDGSAVARADRLRLRWLTAVVSVMALLTVGWPLVSLAIANHKQLAALTTLTIGPSQSGLATVTVGPNWSMIPSQTNPRLDYSLRRGAVGLTIDYVAVIDRARDAHLWDGMREIVRINYPGVRLGQPSPFRTAHGNAGLAGPLAGAADVGTAALVRSPSGTFAIEMIIIGPRHSSRSNLTAARLVLRSLQLLAPRS
jgi:hypothetical protein